MVNFDKCNFVTHIENNYLIYKFDIVGILKQRNNKFQFGIID